MNSFNDIPYYYKESEQFKNIFDPSSSFKVLSFNDFKKSESFLYIRDESEIHSLEDFYHGLECLDYWLIDFLPQYMLDYIFSNEVFLLPLDLYLSETNINKWNQQIIDLTLLNIENSELTVDKIGDPDLYNLVLEQFFKVKYSRIACGNWFSVAIRNDKSMVLWGGEDKDPDEYVSGFLVPTTIKENGDFYEHGYPYEDKKGLYAYSKIEGSYIDVKCGSHYVLAMKEDRTLFSFDDKSMMYVPDGKFIKISCSDDYRCGIREDGKLIIWDYNKTVYTSINNIKECSCNHVCIDQIDNYGELTTLIIYHNRSINPIHLDGKYTNVVTIDHLTVGIVDDEKRNIFTSKLKGQKEIIEGNFNKIFECKRSDLIAATKVEDGKHSLMIFDTDGGILHQLDGIYVDVTFSEEEIILLHSPNEEGCKVTIIDFENDFTEIEGRYTEIAAGEYHFTFIKLTDGVESLFTMGGNGYGQCDNIPSL